MFPVISDIIVAIVIFVSVMWAMTVSATFSKMKQSIKNVESLIIELETKVRVIERQIVVVKAENAGIMEWNKHHTERADEHAKRIDNFDENLASELNQVATMFCATDAQIAMLKKKMLTKTHATIASRKMTATINAVSKKVLGLDKTVSAHMNTMDEQFATKSYVDARSRTIGKKTYEMFYRLYVGHQSFEDGHPTSAQSPNIRVLNNLFYTFEPPSGPFRIADYPNFIRNPTVKLSLE